MTDDAVNHPKHYTAHPSGVECIEITRHYNFNIGNVIKYLWRAGLKSDATHLEDLKKAKWYLEDEIKRLEPSKMGVLLSLNDSKWICTKCNMMSNQDVVVCSIPDCQARALK